MKIERVSENQLKLTLTKNDLRERDLNLEDLINPSEKTQMLFREIMGQALDEYDFIEENTPIMVEALPSVGMDGIMIIVTKLDHNKENKGWDMLSTGKDLRKWKKKPLEKTDSVEYEGETVIIYSFVQMDDVIDASIRLGATYEGDSALYKYNGKFFLVLQTDTYKDEAERENLELMLSEFGEKQVSLPLAKYYLMEHAESIIASKAIATLADAFEA